MTGPQERVFTRRKVLGTAVLLGGGAVAAACSSSSSGAPIASKSSAAATAPKRGGTLRVALSGAGSTDSLAGQAQDLDNWTIAIHENVYDNMAKLTAAGVVPDGLAAFTPASDLMSYKATVRPGATFHNGKPMTADDLAYSFAQMADPKSTAYPKLTSVNKNDIKKLDGKSIQVGLSQPDALLPNLLLYAKIVPNGYDPKTPTAVSADAGSGPFKVQKFTPGEQIVLSRFDDYWGGAPYLDTIEMQSLSDTARVNSLLSGQVDMIDLPYSSMQQVKSRSGLSIFNDPTGAFLTFWTLNKPPFDDVRVRQAFRLLVDRQQMLDLAFDGQGRIANDLAMPSDPCFNTGLPQRGRDVAMAKSLLAAAGKADLNIDLWVAPFAPGVVQQAQVMAQNAMDAGVTVNIRQTDVGTYFSKHYAVDPWGQTNWFDGTVAYWFGNSQVPAATFPESGIDGPALELYHQAQREPNPTKRCMIIKQLQKALWQSGYYIIPAYQNQLTGHSKNVNGLSHGINGLPLGGLKFHGLWLA